MFLNRENSKVIKIAVALFGWYSTGLLGCSIECLLGSVPENEASADTKAIGAVVQKGTGL